MCLILDNTIPGYNTSLNLFDLLEHFRECLPAFQDVCNGEVPWPFPFLLVLGHRAQNIGSGPAQGDGGCCCYDVGVDLWFYIGRSIGGDTINDGGGGFGDKGLCREKVQTKQSISAMTYETFYMDIYKESLKKCSLAFFSNFVGFPHLNHF